MGRYMQPRLADRTRNREIPAEQRRAAVRFRVLFPGGGNGCCRPILGGKEPCFNRGGGAPVAGVDVALAPYPDTDGDFLPGEQRGRGPGNQNRFAGIDALAYFDSARTGGLDLVRDRGPA